VSEKDAWGGKGKKNVVTKKKKRHQLLVTDLVDGGRKSVKNVNTGDTFGKTDENCQRGGREKGGKSCNRNLNQGGLKYIEGENDLVCASGVMGAEWELGHPLGAPKGVTGKDGKWQKTAPILRIHQRGEKE